MNAVALNEDDKAVTVHLGLLRRGRVPRQGSSTSAGWPGRSVCPSGTVISTSTE